MKKFFFYSCGISAIVVGVCAITLTIYMIAYEHSRFNVEIDGSRNGVSYHIRGKMRPDEATEYVRKKTEELKNQGNAWYN